MSLLSLLAMLLLVKTAPSPTPEIPPPKPSVIISFERQNVRENDSVRAKVLISNESKHNLTEAWLVMSAPEFLEWNLDSCEGRQLAPNLTFSSGPQAIGPIAANSTLECHLRGKTGALIEVGEFNTLLALRYRWKSGKDTAESFVTSEKTLKMNLLGSESVAGIPLVLAGYIVPGLIFWMIVGIFGVPWKMDALGDKMIYSVLVSFFFLGLGALLDYLGLWSKLSISRGISLTKLSWLAGAGLIVGALVGGADKAVRYIRRKRLINPSDTEFTLLRKLLVLNKDAATPKSTIKLKKDYTEYIGSLSANQGNRYYMVGWYKVDLNELPAKTPPDVVNRLVQFKAGGSQVDLFDLAVANNLLQVSDSIQTPGPDGAGFVGAFDGPGKWMEDEVSFYTFDKKGWARSPIVVEGEPPAPAVAP
jgi:hypothetical protein